MKQNHLLKIGFVIFLKGATFSDFVDYRLWNYMPSVIQICIPLFWGKFFQLGSSLIKQCSHLGTTYIVNNCFFSQSEDILTAKSLIGAIKEGKEIQEFIASIWNDLGKNYLLSLRFLKQNRTNKYFRKSSYQVNSLKFEIQTVYSIPDIITDVLQ